MNKKELISRIEDIEWEDFEVKEAKSNVPKSAWETVSAFSNTAGGWIVFGVRQISKKFEFSGVSNPEKIETDFISALRGNKFNKKIVPDCRKYNFEGKKVLAFYIPQRSSRDKPIYYGNTNKNTYIRTGSGDQKATQEEIEHFYRQSSFEEKDKELTKFTFKNLDSTTISFYRNYFNQVNPQHRYIGLSDVEFLERIGVIRDKKITYGGLLVFGNEETLSEGISNYRIEFLEISGTSYEDAPRRYDYRISSEENLFTTFFKIYPRLSQKVEIPFAISSGLRQDDPPQLQAIREALVNLMIHTDYFSQVNPRIRLFSDRFEFYNPGALPKELKYILKEDFSLPRNPVIAKIFRLVKFSENIGSGFHKMINGWNSHYGLKPIIDGDFDFYKITFPLVKSTTGKTTGKTTSKTTSKKLNKEFEIVKILENNPHLTLKDVAEQVGLSEEGVRYHIRTLKKRGKIEKVGGSKSGKWVVHNK